RRDAQAWKLVVGGDVVSAAPEHAPLVEAGIGPLGVARAHADAEPLQRLAGSLEARVDGECLAQVRYSQFGPPQRLVDLATRPIGFGALVVELQGSLDILHSELCLLLLAIGPGAVGVCLGR